MSVATIWATKNSLVNLSSPGTVMITYLIPETNLAILVFLESPENNTRSARADRSKRNLRKDKANLRKATEGALADEIVKKSLGTEKTAKRSRKKSPATRETARRCLTALGALVSVVNKESAVTRKTARRCLTTLGAPWQTWS